MTRDVPPLDSSRNAAHTLRPSPRATAQHECRSFRASRSSAFKDVHLGFEEGEVLRGISFDVGRGETKVLLGESGSGKTLIMKLAAGLMRPDAGRMWVMGHDIGEMPEKELLDFRRHIGFVFQEGALFDSMTVADNVAFRLREEEVDEDGNRGARARGAAVRRDGGRASRNFPPSFPAACGGAFRSRGRWWTIRRSFFTIRRPRGSIR